MRCFILILLLFVISLNSFADPLLLTPQEMQKLKKYFPNDEENSENEQNTEKIHYVWKGDAIQILLPLNQEKRIVFPNKITPDLKGALTTDELRLINDDKSLYLTAKKPFSHVRMYVTVENNRQVILMDISTDNKANNATVYVDFPEINWTEDKNNPTENKENTSNHSNNSLNSHDDYVTLIRFAWRQLFSTTRLLNNNLNIARAPMHTHYMIADLIYGDKVYAHPIASWTDENHYVTALELRAKYSHVTSINVSRDLCGDWQAASLYPRSVLFPAHKKTDHTVLFLISSKPFGDSLERCHGSA